MTDLDKIKLCAEAMDLTIHGPGPGGRGIYICFDPVAHAANLGHRIEFYDPFNYDAQAMALEDWLIERGTLSYHEGRIMGYVGSNLNFHFDAPLPDKAARRCALVDCVAKMQAAK